MVRWEVREDCLVGSKAGGGGEGGGEGRGWSAVSAGASQLWEWDSAEPQPPGPGWRFAQHFSSLCIPPGGRTWHQQSQGSSSAAPTETSSSSSSSVPPTAPNSPSVGQGSARNPWGDRAAPCPCSTLGRTTAPCPPGLSGAGRWEPGTAEGHFGANPSILHHEMVSKSYLGLLLLK